MMVTKSKEIAFYRPKKEALAGLKLTLDSNRNPSQSLRRFVFENAEIKNSFQSLGINLEAFFEAADRYAASPKYAADALQSGITTPSIATPLQFLQVWIPGFIHVLTAPRNIDLLVGRTTVGSWEDEQIVFSIRELTGKSRPYGDYTTIPLASWNINQIVRTIVSQEQGIEVGKKEALRSARMNLDDAAEKRDAAALQLEITRNAIGFFGFNDGLNQTYGFLNDPNELPYTTVDTGAGGSTLWSTKTYLEIQKDIRLMLATLRLQTKGAIDPQKTPLTMALATAVADYLTVSTDYGESVQDWLRKNYPNVRVENAPELDAANGGQNVVYMYADAVNDTSTDDKKTFIQAVPTVFMALGVLVEPKKYTEDYSNATAGVSIKRPYALTRWTGV